MAPEIAGSAAFDRAEYSLQQGSIVIALVVGGIALASVGAFRLLGAGFAPMPRHVASIVLASGLGVVAFGIVLLVLGPPSDDTRASMPRATLAPRASAGANVPREGVRGVVVGRDDDPVAGAAVTLVPLFMDDGADPMRTTTDEDGRFSFDDVAVDPGSPWVAEVKFDGARFPSDVLRAPHGEAAPVRIVVADTTKKTNELQIDVESLAVVGDKTGAQAVHALTIVNGGERAYVGGLRLPLLPGATAIQEGSGLDRRYLALGDREMTSTAPILPGRHDLTYTYVVQMARDGLAVDHRTQVPTGRYELLVGDGLSLAARGTLRDDADVTLGPPGAQRTYHRYVARDLDDGDRVEARVNVASGPSLPRVGLFALAALVAVLAVAAPLLRGRHRRARPTDEANEPSAESAPERVPGGAPPNPSA